MCFLIVFFFFTEYCLVADPLKIQNIYKKAIITTIMYLLQNKKVKARIPNGRIFQRLCKV